jgi:CheY-like chemotaxis protein
LSRILLVEDDPLVATVMRVVLTRGGWDIRHAPTGEDALAMAPEWNPALILLDVDLPGINGFDVCRSVREAERGDAPLIVMVTSNDDVQSKLRGFRSGADDYLVKPLDHQELFTRVTKLLGDREAQAAAIAQRRRDAMNEIVATICHELNSPLTGALGYLELALSEAAADSPSADWLTDCRRELMKVIAVVQRLKQIEDRVVPYLGEVTMIELPKEQPNVELQAPAREHELQELDGLDLQ